MIAHLVLFRPKRDLTPDQRASFVTALEYALTNIPLIKRARVGRRLALGRQYDAQNGMEFPFAAILEFDTADHLQEYLNHPAHESLGTQFYTTADAALVFDFELSETDGVRTLLA
jgi:hypothetical protein